ncbi:MAG: alpha-N-arabinofuranosidase [Prevotella sp.]|nr:alpha-N-arabinofuranosidase [Prevotella sp.]
MAQTPSLEEQTENEAAYTIYGNDTTCQIFIYSPNEKNGLHLAYHTSDGTWQHVGQLCSSDYAQWGSEKRMYHPTVVHANDGTWRLVFSVNDHAPCFAAAYSEDLITWRPQDYPHMSQKGCFEPIVFAMDDGTFDIYYKDRQGGKHYVQASADFRKFTEDRALSSIDDVAWLRDTVSVGDKLMAGNMFDVPKIHLDYIRQWFAATAAEDKANSETMRDDATRFAQLPQTVQATLTVSPEKEMKISDKLIGVFFEDISYAADGGLYAELIQNRDFEYTAKDHRGWNAQTAWKLKGEWISTEGPLSENNPHYAVLDNNTLSNEGWDGIALTKGSKYDFSMFTKKASIYKKQKFRVQLVENGVVLAKADFKVKEDGWSQVKAVLIPKADAKKAELQIVNLAKGTLLGIDMVSLFPQDTYKGHGLRKDLAEAIADLKPKFVRFPGGCMSHGQGIDNIYHWNHTVGPWQDRKPDMNIWNYHQTRGLGFYEYFQFCEDIGAEAVPVLAAGVPCQNSAPNAEGFGGQQGGIPMEEMPAYIEELCNLIEWANGDPATNKWAKMRADAGHPAPFNMKYLGIGNEDIISTVFEERCEMIAKEIRERYPEIQICGTAGPFHYPSADYIEGWKFANEHRNLFDLIDEHYYESTGWFMHHLDYYDQYDRKGPKVYVGEYASRTRTHESALAEALFLCNIERNGDIVEMTSYAPLLAKEGHHNWNPDMIYFDNTSLQLTPSYHTQHLFGNHSGDRYVESTLTLDASQTTDDGSQLRVASSVVRDNKTGKTYLKLVNALPRPISVNAEGVSISASASISAFTGKPSDKEVVTFGDNAQSTGKECVKISGNTITLAPYTVCAITL